MSIIPNTQWAIVVVSQHINKYDDEVVAELETGKITITATKKAAASFVSQYIRLLAFKHLSKVEKVINDFIQNDNQFNLNITMPNSDIIIVQQTDIYEE